MSFVAASTNRKVLRRKPRNQRGRLAKRAYLFESLEERLNLSVMFMEVEPNQGTSSTDFVGGIANAQRISHPGLTGIVDSIAKQASATSSDPDFYTFTAAVEGNISVAVLNSGGDPDGDGGLDNLDVRVFRKSDLESSPPTSFHRDNTADGPNRLANLLPTSQSYRGSFSAAKDEQFYVRIVGDAVGDDSNYELRIWNSDVADNTTDNNKLSTAVSLGTLDGATAITFADGTITHPDRDFFSFTAGATGEVSVRITMPEGTGYPFGPNGMEPTNLGVRVRDAASGLIIATSNGTAGNVDIASFDATNGADYYVEVYSGSFGQVNAYDLDISMVAAPTGRITGYVFQDDNLNTLRDPSEAPVTAFDVSIDIGNDTTTDMVTSTDANGFYSFEFDDVPFGTHRVYITPLGSLHATYPDELTRGEYVIQIGERNLNLDHIDFALGEADFGDAPDSYGTSLASDGARHSVRGPLLGALRDSESDAATPLDGAGDDGTDDDDEDGVTFTSSIIQGSTASVDVVVTGGNSLLNAWIDFDGDDQFSAGEQIFTDQPVSVGTNNLSFDVPNTVNERTTYARFRLSTEAGLSFDGPALDGEVEDYAVSVLENKITIDDVTMTEGNSSTKNFSFTVTLDAASNTDISLNFSTADGTGVNAATQPSDYLSTSGALTFAAANSETTKNIVVQVKGDLDAEADEQFFVDLVGITGPAAFNKSRGIGTITNDDAGISITATDAVKAEGNTGTTDFEFEVSRTGDTSGEVSVTYTVMGTGANATNADDFDTPLTGTVTFVAGDDVETLTLRVNGDTMAESDETFSVTLSAPTGGASISAGVANGTIQNDDIELSITPIAADKAEGNNGTTPATEFTFEVLREGVTTGTTTVTYTVAGSVSGIAADEADFVAPLTGTVTFDPGDDTKTITVEVIGDTDNEADEGFMVTLSAPSDSNGPTISVKLKPSADVANGVIRNDDISFNISQDVADKLEGNGGTTTPTAFTFTVTRTASPNTSSVDWDVSGKAGAASPADGADFVGGFPSGTVTFDGGISDVSRTITINVVGDTTVEGDDEFTVTLSNGMNGVIDTGTADGIIRNDDAGLTVTAVNADQAEGSGGGTTQFTFSVARNGSSAGAVSVDYAVAHVTTNAADFSGSTSGTLNWDDGDGSPKPVTINVIRDNDIETDESFFLGLLNPTPGVAISGPASGNIRNDDLPAVTVAVSPTSVLEDSGNNLVYTFTRTEPSPTTPLTINFSFAATGTATFNTDYTAAGYTSTTGTVTFGATSQTATVTVTPSSDSDVEPHETVVLQVDSGPGYTVGAMSSASGTITDDDVSSVTVSVSPASVAEDGVGNLLYTLTRSEASPTSPLTVNIQLSGDAILDTDYTASGYTNTGGNNGTVTFGATSTTATVTVDPTVDTDIESNETVVLQVLAGTGYTLGTPSSVSGTIADDDVVTLITGTKKDASGNAVAGVRFELFQETAVAGTFNPASPFDAAPTNVDTYVQTVETDASGTYRFGGSLANGTYYIREVPSAGWYQTSPTNHVTVNFTGTLVDVDSSVAATPSGPFVNARCSDNYFGTMASFPQTITATRAGIMTFEVVGDAGVSFSVQSESGNVQGLNASLGTITASNFPSRSSGTNRARVDLVLTAADVGKMFTISAPTNGGLSPTLLVANSVFVDTARNLIIQGSNCGDAIFVKDDPAVGGADSDAKAIFVGSYSGRLAEFNTGNNLVGKFNGVNYNATIINAIYGNPVLVSVQISSGGGQDIIRVGDGIVQDSSLDGGDGDDLIRAGAGRSTIRGGNGSDFIVGGSDNDVIYGDAGNDYIHGRAGGDRIFGGDGDDLMTGGDGDDPLIRGNDGNDILSGGAGRDRLLGDNHINTANPPGDIAYVEKNGNTSIDILISGVETSNVVQQVGGVWPGDPVETELNNLINRFWDDLARDTNPAGGEQDTLDEIIALLLPPHTPLP